MSDVTILGFSLILIGAILLIVEFVHPGTLVVIPGTIVFVTGVLLLIFGNFNFLESPGAPFIIVAVVILAGIVAIMYYTRMAPTHPPVASTFDTLKSFTGTVEVAVVPGTMKGKVRVRGEVWSARSEVQIPVGAAVRIDGGEGVTLRVSPADDLGGTTRNGDATASTSPTEA